MSKKKATQRPKEPAPKKVQVKRSSSPSRKHLLWLAAVVIITWICFSPSLKNGFTNWDDNVYVAENKLITSLSGENVKAIFDPANHVSLNYHPITILSLAIDYHFSEFNPHTYHFTNLLFHVFNTALVFWFVFLLSGRKPEVAAIVALFFGIHPMHVESVAWISERKDVLYTFFFMASLIVYLNYLTNEGRKKIQLYIMALLLFVLSILSKAMAVVLPVVLLLIDFYKERSFTKKMILEKIPFFAVSLFFGILASNIQSQEAIAKFDTFTLLQRFMFAAYGMLGYIFNFFAPIKLSNFYPYPVLNNGQLPIVYYAAPIIALALCIFVYLSLKRTRVIAFGFLFYLVTVALVLQFVSVGQVIMADRYSYLPYIGLLFPIAMGVDFLKQQNNARLDGVKKLAMPLLLVAAIVCAWLTFDRCKVWKNSDTLWSDAIVKYPNSEPYRNRGSYLVNKAGYDKGEKKPGENEYDRALADFNISIAMNPNSAKVFTNRANIYGLKNNFDLALADYSRAIELDKSDVQTFFNRAITYSIMKQFDKAIDDYTTVLAMQPDLMAAKQNRAYLNIDNNTPAKALEDLDALIKYNPGNPDYYFYRGLAYYKLGNNQAALADNSAAVQLKPDYTNAWFNRSVINKALGKNADALNDALKAQSLGYAVDAAYINELKGK